MSNRKLTIEIEHDFADIVFLKTDPEQNERIVTELILKPTGAVLYGLSCGSTDSSHYGFEIITHKDFLKSTNN